MKKAEPYLLAIAAFAGLYWVSLANYLLFHCLAEPFSIVIACAIFMIAWNTRSLMKHHYLLFIGIALLWVGSLDLLHMLAYEGMPPLTI